MDGRHRPWAPVILVPLGNLELATGRAPAVPPVLVEATQLDAVYEAVRHWMVAQHFRTEEISGQRCAAISRRRTGSRGCLPCRWRRTCNLASGKRMIHCGKTCRYRWATCRLRARGLRLWSPAGMPLSPTAWPRGRWMRCIAVDARRLDIEIVRVPGAWEIPSAARLARRNETVRGHRHTGRPAARRDRTL